MNSISITLTITLSLCLTLAISSSFRAASTLQASTSVKSKQSMNFDINTTLAQRITVPGSQNVSAQFAALVAAPTRVDRINILDKDSDFVFDFFDPNAQATVGNGGHTVSANRGTFPAVTLNGVSMTVGFVNACSINTPHTHPQATEINFIVNGTFLSGFIAENGARQIQNILYAGQAAIFPQGAIHFEANLECEPAMFVAAFDNEDPGVSQIAQNFFGINPDVLSPVLGGLNETEITSLASGIPANVAEGIEACQTRCGLATQISPPY